RYMYFGGWMDQGQTHDKIYRAHCAPYGVCDSPQAVLGPASINAIHLNDPTIVNMGSYYIMYMTVAETEASAFDPSQAAIYYSTSPTSDGVNWSTPTKLLTGYWLPSATRNASGEVELYANSSAWGGVEKINMGGGGTTPSIPGTRTVFSNSAFYCNVDVKY